MIALKKCGAPAWRSVMLVAEGEALPSEVKRHQLCDTCYAAVTARLARYLVITEETPALCSAWKWDRPDESPPTPAVAPEPVTSSPPELIEDPGADQGAARRGIDLTDRLVLAEALAPLPTQEAT